MKSLSEFINKHIRYPKNIDNPDIEDIIEYNNLTDKELSFFDIKNIERILWHDKLGPIYENIQEDIYENLNHSIDHEKLLEIIYNKFSDYIYDKGDVESKSKIKSIVLFITDNKLLNNEEFKSLLNLYNYYVSYSDKKIYNDIIYYEVYIEPYKPQEETDYIYGDCKGIVYRLVDDNELKKINHHGLISKTNFNRYNPKYIYVFSDINDINKVKHDIKKQGNLHLIKINLNNYSNKLRFYIDPATVNYKAFVTREYIPKYCCEEIK